MRFEASGRRFGGIGIRQAPRMVVTRLRIEHMPEEPPQLADEVRGLVRSIVTGVLDDAGRIPPLPEREAPTPGAGGFETIAVGADHGGFPLKERIAFRLKETGHDVHDCGTDSTDAVDYPDYAHEVARLVADGTCGSGIIVDGAGIGSAMVANKVPGVRAALCYDLSSARNSREHNHANVLTLGAGLIGPNLALQIVEEWLATPWGEGRHADRVAKITAIEHRYAGGSP
ncbi:MAG: ribose 5-phosphate isomerase B [Acidimicrobiia bacterium]|jgi:ribose 5-phosphate isomerase B